MSRLNITERTRISRTPCSSHSQSFPFRTSFLFEPSCCLSSPFVSAFVKFPFICLSLYTFVFSLQTFLRFLNTSSALLLVNAARDIVSRYIWWTIHRENVATAPEANLIT